MSAFSSSSPWDAALNPPPPPVLTYDGQVAISVRYLVGNGQDRRPWIQDVDPEADRKIGVLISLTPILGGDQIERTILVSNPDWKDYTLPSVYKCQGLQPGAPLPSGTQNPLQTLNGQYVRLKLVPRDVKFRDGRTVSLRSLIFDHVYESQAQCWEMAQHATPAAKAPVQPVQPQNGPVVSSLNRAERDHYRTEPVNNDTEPPQPVQQPLRIRSNNVPLTAPGGPAELPTESLSWDDQDSPVTPPNSRNVVHALPDGSWIVLWQSGKSKVCATQDEAELTAAGPEPGA